MKIKEVKDSGRTISDGKKIFDVWVEGDAKKYTCFNPEIEAKIGQDIECTVTEKTNGQYTNYTLSMKKDFGKTFVKSNADKQKALECAVNWLKEVEGAKKENVVLLADFFHKWLMK